MTALGITFREPREPNALMIDRSEGPYRNELRALWVDWPDTRLFVEALAVHFSDALMLSTQPAPKRGRGPRKQSCDSVFDVLILAGLAAFDAAHDSGDRARLRAFIGTILQEAQRILGSLQIRAGDKRWTVHDEEPLTTFLKRCGRPIEIVRVDSPCAAADKAVLAHLVHDRLKEAVAR